MKYWARSSPLGDNLPINQQITDFGCLTTKRAKNFNPYTVEIRKLLKEHNINHNIAPPYYLEKWDLQITPPSLDLHDALGPKKDADAVIMRATSTAHIEENYPNCTKIFTDGSKDPENRSVGAAFVVPELNFEK